MKRLKNVLVGIDVSGGNVTQGSLTAGRQALRFAERTGARVDFLHSIHRSSEQRPKEPPATPGELREALRRAFEPTPSAVADELLISEDPAWLAITRRVLAGQNDLVVVAKRNHGNAAGHRVGSVPSRLIGSCPCAVWVVEPEHTLEHRSVLAATDLTPVGDLATEYGAYLAEADDCQLLVVHAWQIPFELQLSASRIGDEAYERRKREIANAAYQHIVAIPMVDFLQDRAKVCLGCDTPSHAVLAVVEREDPDLVVMGTVSRGGIAGFLVGNTAERLLERLECSLLTVKPEDFVCPVDLG